VKYLAPLLTIFALFTDPSGAPVWVAKLQAIAVTKPNSLCKEGASAKIVTGNGFTCVRESVDETIRRLEAQ
jgi:hypothetical protein